MRIYIAERASTNRRASYGFITDAAGLDAEGRLRVRRMYRKMRRAGLTDADVRDFLVYVCCRFYSAGYYAHMRGES